MQNTRSVPKVVKLFPHRPSTINPRLNRMLLKLYDLSGVSIHLKEINSNSIKTIWKETA
ncbi:MAG: hypothetical protein GY714_03785 [Desulfobacterales bacterium]|nr:hypothetical protein [Desulfobacterales bacterium]